ncbi:MAG: hypothetical protein C0501_25240 [Isosphaera sp.]|nr:hypothetical protein [Isosphaera sp.]
MIELKEVQRVAVTWDNTYRLYEVVEGDIVRAKSGPNQVDVRPGPWTEAEAGLVRHLLGTPGRPSVGIDTEWQGEPVEAVVYPPEKCWVLRRKGGEVHQIHPGHARGFAEERYADLTEREG